MWKRIALVCLLAFPAVACAQGFGSALDFSRARTSFNIDGQSYGTHITEAGVEFGHYWYHHFLDLSIRGGYLGVTQDSNPDLTGLNLGGYYVGLAGTSFFPVKHNFGFTVGLGATYHRVSDSVTNEQYRLHWFGWVSRAGAWYRLGVARFSAGFYYRHFQGSELLSGKTNITQSVEGRSRSGLYGGLSFYTGRRGRVALFVDTGSYQAIMLSFRYGF